MTARYYVYVIRMYFSVCNHVSTCDVDYSGLIVEYVFVLLCKQRYKIKLNEKSWFQIEFIKFVLQDTRWTTLCGCLRCLEQNWPSKPRCSFLQCSWLFRSHDGRWRAKPETPFPLKVSTKPDWRVTKTNSSIQSKFLKGRVHTLQLSG